MRIAALLVIALVMTACGGSEHRTRESARATPTAVSGAGSPGPAATLTRAHARAAKAIDAWRRSGATARGEAPAAVWRPARTAQRVYARLTTRPRLARRVLRRLHGAVRAEARDVVAAQAALRVLNAPQRTRKARSRIRLGPAEPADALLRHYREGQRRSGVPWSLLAAVNLVESDFGRLRNDSIAAAQGPMQFIGSTWAAYGRGGDVHDPRDAILGAARFLAAAGAPRDTRAALYAYNPSRLYVTAVSRYARRIAADPRAFYAFYAWRPPVPGKLTSSPSTRG